MSAQNLATGAAAEYTPNWKKTGITATLKPLTFDLHRQNALIKQRSLMLLLMLMIFGIILLVFVIDYHVILVYYYYNITVILAC